VDIIALHNGSTVLADAYQELVHLAIPRTPG